MIIIYYNSIGFNIDDERSDKMFTTKFTDLHLHSEYSLQDGMIRVQDSKDPKHIKSEIILRAEETDSDTITVTDHGNMYAQAILASVCKTFGFKHMPGCEFYMATDTRHDKSYSRRGDAYVHINSWAKNKLGYKNMCILQKRSFDEGFYYVPRIDKELLKQYHEGIMWSDACVGGTLSTLILQGKVEEAYKEFMWYLDLIGDDFYIEWHNHGIDDEDKCNQIKKEWADKHGVPIIACTDAHYYKKEDTDAHKTLLCIQYGKWADDPTFDGFPGDGYWLLNEDELLSRYPKEYCENTRLLTDKCEGNIIEFGDIRPPQFKIPEDFVQQYLQSAT